MAIIYSYPLKGTPNDNDLIVISDSEATDPKLRTKQVTVASIKGATASGVSQIIAGTNITISPVTGTGIVTINSSGGGGGTPGGSDTQMQYNNGGSFGGTTGLTWDDSTNILSIATRYEGDIDGAVLQQVLVKESGGVSKGDVVYISGGTGDNPEVMKAQANSVSTMAALGIMKENVALDAIGECVTSGEITGLNLTGFTTGDELFVSNTTAGGLLTSAPTGEANLVQKIGKVIKGGTGGALTVLGAFRTNATPNLNQGSLFIGNGSNQTSTLAIGTNTHVLTSNGTTASWQAIPSSGVTDFTNSNGTFVSFSTTNTNATGAVTVGSVDLSATGTPSASTFLRGDNTWATPAGGGSSEGQILKTNIYRNDSTNPATFGSFTLPNAITANQVSFTTSIGAVTQTCGISFNVPAAGKYVRVELSCYIDTGSSSASNLQFGLHNTNGNTISGSAMQYGWQNPGISPDDNLQVSHAFCYWDIRSNDFVDGEGESISSGNPVTLFLKGCTSGTSTEVMFATGTGGSHIGQNIISGKSGGPLVLTAYEFSSSLRSENPGANP